MATDLFYGNTFILFLILVISIFTLDKLSERQKIAILYLCSYGIALYETIPESRLLLMMTVVLFLMQEYFSLDRTKIKLLYKIHYKIADFIFMGMFQYKIWLIYIAIGIRASYIKECVGKLEIYVDAISLIVFIIAFIWIFNVSEEYYSFTEMYNIVWKTPYSTVTFDENLKERLEIITIFEDHLYWERKKTYSSFSFEYLWVWVRNRIHYNQGNYKCQLSMINRFKRTLSTFIRWLKKLPKIVRWIKRIINRGHSTIPMQLIRILGYRHGLVFGSTKIKNKFYKIIKRKIYEVIYSRMFFEGLKHYLIIELCNNLDNYREYLVYLYPQIVQTTIDGKVYSPARKAFAKKEREEDIPIMNDWDIDKVIRMGFGFNGLSITEKRMEEKRNLVENYNFVK